MPAGGGRVKVRMGTTLLTAVIVLVAGESRAQNPSDSAASWLPGWRAGTTAAAIGVALLEDRHIDEFARTHRTKRLDRLARDVDPFGKAHYVVPVLVTSFAL